MGGSLRDWTLGVKATLCEILLHVMRVPIMRIFSNSKMLYMDSEKCFSYRS